MKSIILLTDFGISDNFVGVMKGVMLNINKELNFIDLTHNIEAQNIFQAAFILKNSYKYFPEGSIFLCVVDPGVGTERDVLFLYTDKYIYVAPDNGLLSPIIEESDYYKLYKLYLPNNYISNPESNTFHGRDIFSPLAAVLSRNVKPEEIGVITDKYVRLDFPKPVIKDNLIEGEIIYIDKFGNCISNIDGNIIKNLSSFKIFFKDKVISDLSYNYSIRDEIGCIIDSFNLLELFAPSDSLKNKLKVVIGEKIKIKY